MTDSFEAWHLPGLHESELTFTAHQLGDLLVRVPDLTPEQLMRVLAHIDDARSALQRTTTRDIVAAIDAVAARLSAEASPEGALARALLPAATGFSPQTIEDVLQHMLRDWRTDSLNAMLRAELGDDNPLDTAVHDTDRSRYISARGPRIAYQVFSGNVPGVAVTSLIRCLLVKAASVGKTAAGEPVLPVLFARALAAIAPELARCIAVTYWPGGTEALEVVATERADVVIVYGGADAVRAVTQRVGADKRVLVHGPKLSLGLIGRAAAADTAAAIAYAVAAYDQQGCVSPHVIYAEENGLVAPKELARSIAHELEKLSIRLPRRRLSVAETLALRAARARAEFRSIAGTTTEVFGAPDASYTVIYEEDTTFVASCLNRTVYIKPIASAEAVVQLLQPYNGILQSVAIAGFSANQAHKLTMLLANCGVTRVTSFELLPWPPMWWHHDGRGPLRELLTWHDLEF